MKDKPASAELDESVARARSRRRGIDAREGQLHMPNHIPRQERVANVLLSVLLFAYCTFGAVQDDIYIPGKRSAGVHLHGTPMWVMYASMLCAVANLMSVVVDHYDVRANEIDYKRFARVTQVLGWALLIGAYVLDVFVYRKASGY